MVGQAGSVPMPAWFHPAGVRSTARTTLSAGDAAHVLRLLLLPPAEQTFVGPGKALTHPHTEQATWD